MQSGVSPLMGVQMSAQRFWARRICPEPHNERFRPIREVDVGIVPVCEWLHENIPFMVIFSHLLAL